MRFLHTADWHLGRLFFGTHLTGDQAHVLDQFVELVKETRPDAVVVAGDIYDRAVPPPDAVKLLDDVLCRIVVDHKTPMILIAGNHDSPERLQFGSRMFSEAGLHVSCFPGPVCAPITFQDKHGPVHFYAVPYSEPVRVREVFDDDGIVSHASAMDAICHGIMENHPRGERSVLIGHAFVSGGEESESERPLSVGNAEMIPASVFADFNYVALGHLHAPQQMGGGRVRYSGSLLKLSFSEAEHHKGVSMVEIDGKGAITVERIALSPLRDVRIVRGTMKELIENPGEGNCEDYLLVQLDDPGTVFDAMGRLREVYPNVMHLERMALIEREGALQVPRHLDKMNDAELFTSFFDQIIGSPPTEEQVAAYASVVDELRREQREAN